MSVLRTHGLFQRLAIAPIVIAVCVLASLMIFTPARTHAQGLPLVACTGTHSATWTPGLTNTAQVVNVSTQSLWSCPLSGTSASSAQEFPQELSCDSLLQPTSVTWVIKWANGQTSTAKLNGDVEDIDGNLVIPLTGTITAGLYQSNNIAITVTDTNLGATLSSACSSPGGLTSASGPSILAITPSL